MEQSNISKNNIRRLKAFVESDNLEVQKMARLVLEVAAIKSHKKKRMSLLARKHPDLCRRLTDLGLIHSWIDDTQFYNLDD